jgi:hypothetical protein
MAQTVKNSETVCSRCQSPRNYEFAMDRSHSQCRRMHVVHGAVINVNKRYIASLCILSSTVVAPLRRAASSWQKKFRFCLAHPGCAGAARTMKLFRTAFWLGVVIYNLPSPASQPAAPESRPNGGQGLAAKAVSRLCSRPRESCSKNDEALANRGDRGGHSSSRDTAMPSQDTLTPTDRAEPWRAPAVRNPSPAARTAASFWNSGPET